MALHRPARSREALLDPGMDKAHEIVRLGRELLAPLCDSVESLQQRHR